MITPKIIQEIIQTLPVMPQTAMRVIDFLQDDNHSLHELVECVSSDVMLTAHILRFANSSRYGGGSIGDIFDALAIMGEVKFINVVLNSCMHNHYNKELTGYQEASSGFWEHSLRTAIAASQLHPYLKPELNKGMLFTGGLLHNVGKLILTTLLEKSNKLKGELKEKREQSSFLKVEQSITGSDHCEAGALLAKHWKLPTAIQHGIRYHHTPSFAPKQYQAFVYCIHLSDILAMSLGGTESEDQLAYPLDEKFAEYINIDADSMDALLLNIQINYEKMLLSTRETT